MVRIGNGEGLSSWRLKLCARERKPVEIDRPLIGLSGTDKGFGHRRIRIKCDGSVSGPFQHRPHIGKTSGFRDRSVKRLIRRFLVGCLRFQIQNTPLRF